MSTGDVVKITLTDRALRRMLDDAACDALTEQLQDAERYRWLRHKPGYIRHLDGQAFYLNWNGSADALDAAIDAAMKGKS